ncbi:toprim domain-containing protein [Clostridium tagluense]|uniref:DNA topoisomerase (ATP-hydrolyzing) n=1 Tax=Clostridium tagluense TaxID=360422 RepID=A0A401UQG8_9CLOT|nr:toprim domain-containing protein [Clostridium tagluense]GCD11766.1 DNA gyrase subunit B [Clostridium tagluense]
MQNDKVRALNHREQARDKLPVFFGSRDNFQHGVKEILNNMVDEILNNFEEGHIYITLDEDLKTITLEDTGRGLPLADIDDNNTPYYELLFTTLFAGGKYEKGDKVNSGTNGLGMAVLNMTSTLFEATSCNLGKEYYIDYADGGIMKTPLTFVKDTDKHGTKLVFQLDSAMYTNVTYTYEAIKFIIDRTSKVSPKITFTFTYIDNEEIFHYDSLEDYFLKHTLDHLIAPIVCPSKMYEELIKGEEFHDNPAFENPRPLETRERAEDFLEKTQIEVVMSCSNEETLLQESMLNGNNLIERSSIHDGVILGIKTFINKYAKDNNLYEKKEKPISNTDVEGAITFCCNVESNNVEFKGQTKFSTEKELYKEVAKKYIQEMLEIHAIEKKDDFVRMVKQILICKRAYEQSTKTIEATKKKLSEKVDNMNGGVDGLDDCKIHDEESEIYIAEGTSALGSIILARDYLRQAGFAITGKVLNCLKANYEKIFANLVIMNLIRILGCGVDVKSKFNKELGNFNIKNLRYGRIVIATDADFDGQNIQVLLLTMIYRLMRELIVEGKVYIAQTPKYIIKQKDDKYYAFTDLERDEKVAELNLQPKNGKVTSNYLKGLGELDAIDMYNTALNPETRVMTKVTIGSVEKMIENFEIWMDDDVTRRREFIMEHLHEYINDEE